MGYAAGSGSDAGTVNHNHNSFSRPARPGIGWGVRCYQGHLERVSAIGWGEWSGESAHSRPAPPWPWPGDRIGHRSTAVETLLDGGGTVCSLLFLCTLLSLHVSSRVKVRKYSLVVLWERERERENNARGTLRIKYTIRENIQDREDKKEK